MDFIRGGLASALVAGLAGLSWYGARNDVRRMERAGVDTKQSTAIEFEGWVVVIVTLRMDEFALDDLAVNSQDSVLFTVVHKGPPRCMVRLITTHGLD